jgi:uncharacterized membrane protein YgdD (TMEM256/DUF423 family)
MERTFLIIGSASAFIGIAAGALGAHVLQSLIQPNLMTFYDTAVHYQMYHALGMGIVAVALHLYPGRAAVIAGWLFIVGSMFFSGCLYIFSLTGIVWLGAITPIGGLAFLAGWTFLFVHFYKNRKVRRQD